MTLSASMYLNYPKVVLFLIGLLMVRVPVQAQDWSRVQAPYSRKLQDVHIAGQGAAYLTVGGNVTNDSIASVFTTGNGGLGWNIPMDVMHPMLNGVDFSDALLGLAVGNNGIIMDSQDGGASWDTLELPIDDNLYSVYQVNSIVGHAVGGLEGGGQVILRTENGGQSWSVQLDGLGNRLMSVYFTDPMNGVAVGESGTILRTEDGGQDWNSVIPPVNRDFNSVEFTDASTG